MKKYNKCRFDYKQFVRIPVLLLFVSGCVAPFNGAPGISEEDIPVKPVCRISEIRADITPSVETLTFFGNCPLVFSATKQVRPPGLILYFPKMKSAVRPVYPIAGSRIVTSVHTSQIFQETQTLGDSSAGYEGTRMEIPLKTDIPHRIAEKGNKLSIIFPIPASRIKKSGSDNNLSGITTKTREFSTPPAKVIPKTGSGVNTTGNVETPSGVSEGGKIKKTANDEEIKKAVSPPGKTKIALDFYDTDIKNVFRILADITDKNFAVDKDVTGRVTLALDNPVPWDQLLDLILVMNQLGKSEEGNIIRIATQETLKREDEELTAKLRAKQMAEMQEDLVTEYIMVNYANAEKDIFPHIQQILTKNLDGSTRGTVSVDGRNNVIILTDVPVTITRARDIVLRLDRVTPQVMIEARIVEANTTFSRDIGVDWSSQSGIPNTDPRAGIGPQRGFNRWRGTYGWDTAIRLPVPDAPSFGFNFQKLLGTPFMLDARLSVMETNDEGKVISSPRIMTLDNQEAVIKQGLEVGYIKSINDQGEAEVAFKEVELVLKVKPHVTMDKRVSLDLQIIKDDVLSTFQTTVGEIPLIGTKEAKTELLVDNGETVVIGGIAVRSTGKEDIGLPWLKNIPLLGWLFKRSGTDNEKRELLLFITPQIVQLEQRPIAGGF